MYKDVCHVLLHSFCCLIFAFKSLLHLEFICIYRVSYSISGLFSCSFLIIEGLDFILLSDRVSLVFFISLSEFFWLLLLVFYMNFTVI